uniref:Uncharacterized protein n=1 Tax=Arion vulgaris TaxID=1028688 RepID=A0A0B7B0A0_9EUPU
MDTRRQLKMRETQNNHRMEREISESCRDQLLFTFPYFEALVFVSWYSHQDEKIIHTF